MGKVPVFLESIKHAFPVGYIEREKALEYAQADSKNRGVLPMIIFLSAIASFLSFRMCSL